MKVTKYIAMAATVLSLCACEREFVKTTVADESKFVAPVLQPVSDVVVDANNNKVESVTFVWSPASFGVSTQIDYNVYAMSVVEEDEYVALLGSTSATSLSVTKEDLNSLAVSDLALPRNATSELTVWVHAQVSGLRGNETVSENKITFNITTFDPPKDWVFFPGYYNSWGDNNDKEEWRVWEVEGGTGVYRTLVKLKEDAANTPGICPLKLYMNGAWLGGKDGYEATWEGWDYGDANGNWGVPADEPINIIEFNKSKKTASRTHISGVGLIGSFSASNWEKDVFFEYDDKNNVWVTPEVTFAAGDEFLVRLNESWDGKFKHGGPLKATDVLKDADGNPIEAYELVNDGSAENIAIPEAGTYVFKLYANRTPRVLVMEKK